MLGLVACLLTLLAAPLAAVAGVARVSLAAPVGALVSAAAAFAFALAWAAGGGSLVDVPWLPPPFAEARLTFVLDDLGALYATLVTGLGAVVTVYSRGYLPPHLEHRSRGATERRPAREEVRFVALLLAFMASMVALVLAQDLLLMFVALDVTALLSFLLIRFDYQQREARQASLMALFVTAGPSPFFVVGALLLGQRYGTTSLAELSAQGATATSWAAGLLVAGVLAKSAQVPLHFWLPRAMVAPTPVSAFLHSAAMVAAGVIVLQRVRPLLEGAPQVLAAMLVIGLASIVVGSAGALVRDELKAVLAASTIAQYGHVMVLLALGGDDGNAGAPLYVVVHGLCKAALFLSAGAVTLTTGQSRLSQLGGLLRARPLLAMGSGVAALGLAGAPLTGGYFKDEALFAAAWRHSPWLGVALTVVVALTAAYALRFWTRIFLGPRIRELELRPTSRWLTLPIALLAVVVVALGAWPWPVNALANAAGALVNGGEVSVHLSYGYAGARTLSALFAWLLGLSLFALQRRLEHRTWLYERVPWLLSTPLSRRLLRALWRLSDYGHGVEARDMRDRVGFVLLPSAALIALAAFFTSQSFALHLGGLRLDDMPTALALVVAGVAAIAAASMRKHVAIVLMLSFVGFSLALVFSATGAPDVALVAVLIETMLTLLFLTALSRVPEEQLRRSREHTSSFPRRQLFIAGLAGGATLFLTWTILSLPRPALPTLDYLELAEDAHAMDVVTSILADFRGLDTMGEMTVLAVAAVGVLAMTWRRPA